MRGRRKVLTKPRLASRTKILARTAPGPSDHLALAARDWAIASARRRQSRTPPGRIGLIGLFGLGNAGNDGSLEAMLIFLRKVRPDAELVCFCAVNSGASEKVARDFRLATVPLAVPRPAGGLLRVLDMLSLKAPRQLASLVRALAQARKLDLLIAPGMGMLDDFTDRPLDMPLALFGWCLAARLCGARIAFVSVGAGPITHPISRWLLKAAAAMAHYRSYRDGISKDFMDSIGFDTSNDEVFPDIAFKLPAPLSDRAPASGNGPLTVGVGVMTYHGLARCRPTRRPDLCNLPREDHPFRIVATRPWPQRAHPHGRCGGSACSIRRHDEPCPRQDPLCRQAACALSRRIRSTT